MPLSKYLTTKDWKLQKLIITFLGEGGTGIGKKLATLEAAYAQVNWKAILEGDPSAVSTRLFDASRAAMKDEFDKVKKVEAAAKDLATLAGQVEPKLKKAKTIPGASAKYVEHIKTAANALAAECAAVDTLWNTQREETRQLMLRNRDILKAGADEWFKDAARVKATDDKAVAEQFAHYSRLAALARGMSAYKAGSHAAEDPVLIPAAQKLDKHVPRNAEARAAITDLPAHIAAMNADLTKFITLLGS